MTDIFFGCTDTGKQRQNNEDTFIAQQADDKFIIACVIDGVGGYAGGEVAAGLARESILQRLQNPSGNVVPMLVDCFNLANQKIISEKQTDKKHSSMACVATLAVIDIEKNIFNYAHVGDTRLYLLRDNSLIKISHDQSFVGFLEDSGRLTEEAAMKHPKRNEINKALGFETQLAKSDDYIETGQSPFLPGDMVLLCSDGLTDMVDKQTMEGILTQETSLKEKCAKLIAQANANGGKDNITVVLVKNNKNPLQHNATMPAAGATKSIISEDKPHLHEEESSMDTTTPSASKSTWGKAPVIILSLLTFLFLGATVWQYLENQNRDVVSAVPKAVVPVPVEKNKQEIKLQQSINNLKGNVLILTDTGYQSPVVLTQPISVNRDTIIIKNKGKIVFRADTSNKGTAFDFSAKCSYVVLDSVAFSGFATAIVSRNNNLSLNNTSFLACGTPVQYLVVFPQKKYISCAITPVRFKADSLPMITK